MTREGDVLFMDQDALVAYQDAIIGPESDKWLEVMGFDMEFIYTNHVYMDLN